MFYALIRTDTGRVKSVYKTPEGFSPPDPEDDQAVIPILEQEFNGFLTYTDGPVVFSAEDGCLVFQGWPPEDEDL